MSRTATMNGQQVIAQPAKISEWPKVGPALPEPATTRKFLLAQLRDRPYEVFCWL
jgi:hypothetical protein